MAFGVYGMSAITALTAQNTVGVQGIYAVSPEFVTEQIKSIMTDIGTDAAKTGMLANEQIVKAVVEAVKKFNIPNLVVDPVMVAKSGDPLLSETAQSVIKDQLIPLATVITPNVFEDETMLNKKIESLDDMKEAAVELKKIGCTWVVLKEGHIQKGPEAIDVVYDGQEFQLLKSERFKSKNTHGTGCTFASAIAAGFAKGMAPLQAIQRAKSYITEAIREGIPIDSGHGPTNHFVGTQTRW